MPQTSDFLIGVADVNSNTPISPAVTVAIGAGILAGASASLDTADSATAKKLWEVHVSSSVSFKFQVQTVTNGVATNASSLILGTAGTTVVWKSPHRNFVTIAGGTAGLDAFRAVVTNTGAAAADINVAFYFEG